MNYRSRNYRYMQMSIMMIVLVSFLSGCGGATKYTDLAPQTLDATMQVQQMHGSINIRTVVPTRTAEPTYAPMDINNWLDSHKLKKAITKTITDHAIFSQVSEGKADYVLDVWVEKVQNVLEITGEGFIFDIRSIWRLSRVSDGKIVACEFVKGHGASRKFGSNAYPDGISLATRDMLQQGLFAISDQTRSHLTALSTAGDRPDIAKTE